MEQLVEELKSRAGLSQEQSEKAIEVIKDFILGQVPPAFSDMVNNFFKGNEGGGVQDAMSKIGF